MQSTYIRLNPEVSIVLSGDILRGIPPKTKIKTRMLPPLISRKVQAWLVHKIRQDKGK